MSARAPPQGDAWSHYGMNRLFSLRSDTDGDAHTFVHFSRRIEDVEMQEVGVWIADRFAPTIAVCRPESSSLWTWTWARSPATDTVVRPSPPRTTFGFYRPRPDFVFEFTLRWR